MPLIQSPTPGRKLQRGLRLTELPDAILAPELVGVIIVDDFSAPLSFEERGCAGVAGVLATVGENSFVSLVRVGDPASYDLIITAISFSAPANTLIRVIGPSVAIAGVNISPQTGFTDRSVPGRPTSQIGFRTQVGILDGEILYEYNVLPATSYRINGLAVRLGTTGDGIGRSAIAVSAVNANTGLNVGYEWTESGPLG